VSWCGGNDPPQTLVWEEIKEKSPNFVYIHGMTASGKSTLADKLSAIGYKSVDLDELVREEFPKWPADIYTDSPTGMLTAEQEKLFTRLKKEMEGTQKVVVNGFIAPLMWKKLYQYRPWDLLVFVQHRNPESYKIAIMNRVIRDLDTGVRTLSRGIWNSPGAEEMAADYKEKGTKSEKFQKMVDAASIHKWDRLQEGRQHWGDLFKKNGWKYYIYYTDLTGQ
jgi:hypothetical protein